MEICFCENMEGLYGTMDNEKLFDSLDNSFMTNVLKNFGFIPCIYDKSIEKI